MAKLVAPKSSPLWDNLYSIVSRSAQITFEWNGGHQIMQGRNIHEWPEWESLFRYAKLGFDRENGGPR